MTQAEDLSYVLREVKEGTLATVRADGWPQATIVSFVTDGASVWFDCHKGSQKASNLARDDRVSMTVMVPYLPWGDIRAFSLAGHARLLSAPEEIEAVLRRWLLRFPHMDKVVVANGADFLFYELRPEQIEPMDYLKGLGHGKNPRGERRADPNVV